MKVLKYILFIVLFLFFAYIVLCFMGPKHMAVSKTVTMNASPSAIFEEVADFSKWTGWSPWHKLDPNMKSTTTGNPGEVGHKQSWESENGEVGTGSQKFVEIRTNEFIKSEMHFMGEDSSPAFSTFEIKPEGEATSVTWAMDGGEGDIPFMLRGMMKIMNMEKMLGGQFEQGLNSLKAIAEAKPKEVAVQYEVLDMPEQWYVGVMHIGMNEKDINADIFAKDYEAIGKAIGGMDKMTGMPIDIAHNFNQATNTMDLEVALPVAAKMSVPAGFTCSSIPAGKVAKYVYKGAYENSGKAWGEFMSAVMKDHQPRWDPYEVYANDPKTVSSPEEYITWLIQPIQ